jgi:hypothetical protein
MLPTWANTAPFRRKDMQKSAVFKSLGSSPPALEARGDELKGDPKVGHALIVTSFRSFRF